MDKSHWVLLHTSKVSTYQYMLHTKLYCVSEIMVFFKAAILFIQILI